MILLAQFIFEYVLAIVVCLVVHESAHYISSLLCGKAIEFRFEYGMLFNIIPIPRLVWDMPLEFTTIKRTIVALSGFVVEILFTLVLYFIVFKSPFTASCLVTSILHLCLYSFYSGDNSDFRFIEF